MNDHIYVALARRLDELPQGYPPTQSGVELKILKKIFTPEEAQMTLNMMPIPETAEAVAERLGRPVEEMRQVLDQMAANGQIGSFKIAGRQVYKMIPFVVGIYEFQRDRLDRELAELFEEYMPVLVGSVGGHKPHLARVIPVNVSVKAALKIHAYEDARRIVEKSKSFRVQYCICRREQALLGNPCKHSTHNCLQVSKEEGAWDYFKLDGDVITKERALEILRETEGEGLVHSSYNVADGTSFICNCCSCCCGIMRGLKEHQAPYMLAHSRFVAKIDAGACAACGVCRDERCPVDAIVPEDDGYRVLEKRCIGCGVCTLTCPSDAIQLVPRPESERAMIADNLVHWEKERFAARRL